MDIEVNLIIQWIGPKQNTIHNTTILSTIENNTYEAIFSTLFMKNDSGNYTCNATLATIKPGQLLSVSETVQSNPIRITTGIAIYSY